MAQGAALRDGRSRVTVPQWGAEPRWRRGGRNLGR